MSIGQSTNAAMGGAGAASSAAALGAGGALAGGLGGAYAAYMLYSGYASAKAAEEQQRLNNEAIVKGALDQYHQLDAAERDINSQASEDLEKNQLSMLSLQESAKVMAGATGTQGSSVNSVLKDIAQTGGRNQAAIIANRTRSLDSITRQAKSLHDAAISGQDVRSLSRPSAAMAIQQGVGMYQTVDQLWRAYQEYQH